MPLQTQIVDVPFAGVDQKTAVELVPPGKFITVNNGIFVKRGEVRKRFGFVNLPDTLTAGNVSLTFPLPADGQYIRGEALITRESELLFIGEATVNPGRRTMGSWSEATNVWNTMDFPASVRSFRVWSANVASESLTNPCVASANGIAAYVAIASANLLARVVDVSSGTDVQTTIGSLASSFSIQASNLNACSVGDWLFVTFRNDLTGDFWVWSYNTVTLAETVRQVPAFFSGGTVYDICPYVDNGASNAVILVVRMSASNSLDAVIISSDTSVAPVNQGGVVTSASTITGVSICFAKDTNPPANKTLWITWCDSSGAHVQTEFYNPFLPGWVVVGTDTFQNPSQKVRCALVTDSSAFVVASNSSNLVEARLYDETATVIKASAPIDGMSVCGQPFIDSGFFTTGYVYAPMLYADSTGLQNTVFLVRFDVSTGVVEFPVPVATLGPRVGPLTVGQTENWKVSASGNSALLAVPARQRILEVNGTSLQALWGMNVYSLELHSPKGYIYSEAQSCSHVASGTLVSYDGHMLSEIGFSNFPVIAAPVMGGAGSGSLDAGSYAYAVVYTWQDDKGRLHRSAPSAPQTVTAVATDSATLTIKAPAISWRWRNAYGRPLVAEVYRTLVDGSVTSSLDGFYFTERVTLPQYGTVTVTDTNADSVIADNPQIYTAGGILEDVMPPTCSVTTLHKNRIWINSAEDDDILWFSRELVTGEAPSFNDILTVAVPGGGRVTGIAPMDTRLIVFKQDRVFVVYGDGPNDQGVGGSFTAEQLQPIQLGCIDERSVQRTSFGVFFWSSQGLFVMTRSLDAQQVGARVEDSLNQFPAFAGVVSMPSNQEVRLVVRTSEDQLSEGRSVLYNTFFDEWSTWTIKNFNGDAIAPAATVISRGKHYVADGYGIVWVEDKTCWTDACGAPNEQWVPLELVSPWIRMGAVEGFQRTRRIGIRSRSTDDYRLTVKVETDYGNSTNGKYPWQESTFDFASTDPESRFAQVHIAQQTSPSVRVTLTDAPPTSGTSTGQGPALVGLSLELGLKSGENKLPATWRK